MPQKTSPFLEGKWGWNFGEGGWNTGADENWLKFSYMFDRNVDGIVSSLPPAVNGQAYFNTTDNRFYFVVDGTYYSSPCPKWFEFVLRSTGEKYVFDGSAPSVVPSSTSLDSRIDAVELTLSDLTGDNGSLDINYISSYSNIVRSVRDKLDEYPTIKTFGGIGDGTLHPLSERYSTLTEAQADYPFATSLTQSIDDCAVRLADQVMWATRKTLRDDGGVYVMEDGLDSVADWDLAGCAQLAPFPLEGDAKEFLRPGYKGQIPGTVFLFTGTGAKSMTTQRVDQFSSFTYCIRSIRTGSVKKNFSIVCDVDVYNAGGTLTAYGADNSAVYGVGHVIDDAAQTLVADVTVFGYFTLAGTIVRSVLGADDPDYTIFRGGSTMGRIGLALIGSDTDDGFDSGLSGTQSFGMDIFTIDHHSRSPGTAATIYANADTWRFLYIDGHTDAVQADINGHYFHGGSMRSYCIHGMEIDEASQAYFIGCIFESSDYAGVPNAATKQWLFSSLTQDVGFESCRFSTNPGLLNSAAAGSMKGQLSIKNCPGLGFGGGLLVAEKDGGGTVHWIKIGGASGGTGDPAIQMGSGSAATSTAGWNIRKRVSQADLLDFTYGGTALFNIDTNGAINRLVLRKGNLTIAGGVITLTGLSSYNVDTEAAAATDDLDTINGGVTNQLLYLNSANSGRDINVTEAGNIRLIGTSFTLSHPQDTIVLRYDGVTWNQLTGADVTA